MFSNGANMLALLREFFSRFSRAAAFANTDNLGDALRLMGERHLIEVERRHYAVAHSAARKIMNRPQPSSRVRASGALRQKQRSEVSVRLAAVN